MCGATSLLRRACDAGGPRIHERRKVDWKRDLHPYGAGCRVQATGVCVWTAPRPGMDCARE